MYPGRIRLNSQLTRKMVWFFIEHYTHCGHQTFLCRSWKLRFAREGRDIIEIPWWRWCDFKKGSTRDETYVSYNENKRCVMLARWTSSNWRSNYRWSKEIKELWAVRIRANDQEDFGKKMVTIPEAASNKAPRNFARRWTKTYGGQCTRLL